MIIQATPSNYWISPTALHFELNALENPDYIHANASGDASILVYIKDIIDYDDAHNYRKFPLSLASTAFGSVDPKYIYVAIPRTLDNTIPSVVVFPSVQIDIYGKAIITNQDGSLSQGDQLGNDKYYYVFLQGIISASETASAVVNRTWTHNIDTGILSSDEASVAGSANGWWLYNAATDLVTFTKKIANAVIATLKIDTLTFGNGSVKSVSDTAAYSETDNESVATPKFVSFFGNKTYLSKLNDDEAEGIINFKKGIKFNDKPVTDILTSTEDITASDTILLSIKKSLATFLRKDVADSTDFLQTFTKGIISLYIQSAGFSTGMLGSGFTLKIDENGDSYLEVDRGLFRKTATFYELLIQKIKSVGGQIILTPTQMHCIKVEEQADSYRCYFKNTEDNRTIYNEFEINDLARCQDFNLKSGANYYWRKVIAVGDDYIDLSKTDCDTGSGIPAAGDDIIQIGNSSDVTRQGSIVLSAFGAGSSYIKVYKGINSYNLTGKEKLTLSPDLVDITADSIKFSTGESVKSYIDKNVIIPCGDYVYGTDYLKNSLVTFNNQLFLSLQETSDCPIMVLTDENGNPLVTETGAFITPTDADGNVTYNPSWKFYSSNEAVENDVAKFKKETTSSFQVLNDQVDSKVSSTTFNALGKVVDEHSTEINQLPDTISASITKSVEEGGSVYNAIATSLSMTDEGISLFGKSLVFNGTAVFTGINDKIQSKAHTFTSQPTDAEAYNVGDIWVNATSGSFNNDILKCITAKAAGAAFNIAHWQLASKYTDDSAAQEAARDLSDYKDAMNTTINGLQSQIDGEVDSWFNQVDPTTSNAPASEWTTDILKQRHANDTYTNTNTGASWKWIQTNNVWGWTPIADTATQKALANAAKAQDTADGKRRVFTAQPTIDSIYDVGDIWVNATVGTFANDMLVCITHKAAGASFNIAHWKLASKYTDDTKATEALDYRDTFAKNLGYASLNDMETQASLPDKKTIIKNGLVNIDLLEAQAIFAKALQTEVFDAEGGTIENLNVVNCNNTGSFRSPMFYMGTLPSSTYHNNVCVIGNSTLTLDDEVDNVGRLIRVIHSYSSDKSLTNGDCTIYTNGSKIYEDGVANDSIIINREMVELLGMGNETTFFGWQVLNRIDTITEHSYGRRLKVIAEGVVTGTSTGASIRGRCWDKRIDFAVSRQGIGMYVIAFNSNINVSSANDIIVMATGIGHAAEDQGNIYSPIKATVAEVVVVNGTLSVTIITSDDATANDGSFNFMITNMNDFGVE